MAETARTDFSAGDARVPDNVFSIRLSGTLTRDEVASIGWQLEAMLARFEKIGILADATGSRA